MDINYFDIVVGVIVLLLGLKGIFNGFFKELFGLIGIIGGIFIASRFSEDVGKIVSDLVFKFDNQSAINFTGFLITLAAFWLIMILLGMLFKKFANASGLGPVDKLFGFILGSSKFFMIAAVIIYALSNINAMKQNVINPMMKNSVLFPIMVEVGSIIMKLDPTEVSKEVGKSIKETSSNIQDSVKETTDKMIDSEAKKLADDVKSKIKIAKEKIEKD